MIYTSQELREKLADRRLSVVARECNVSYDALWRMMKGHQKADEEMLTTLTAYVQGRGEC